MARFKQLGIGYVFDDSLDRYDGVQQYIKTLGNWMSDRGHRVHYLVGETEDAKGYKGQVHSLAKNFSVSGNQNKLSIPLPANRNGIEDVLAKYHFDVLHVQMPYNPFMSSKVIGLADDHTAIISTFHIVGEGWFEKYGSKLLSLSQFRSLSRIDKFLSVSEAAQDFSKQYFGIESSISPNVVNLEKFKKAKLRKTEKLQILFLGRLVERKGAQHLIGALPNIHSELRELNAQVIIAGDGPMRADLEAMVKELDLEDIVVFVGFVDEEDKASLIKQSEMTIFPSTGGESFGIVLIEAMATDGPIVLGGNNVGYKTVLGGHSKLLIDPTDSEAFARRILFLLKDKSAKKRAKKWQEKRVADFDVANVGKDVEKIYKQSIKQRLELIK